MRPQPAWKSRVPQPPPVPADYMDHEIPDHRGEDEDSDRDLPSVSDFHFSDSPELQQVNPHIVQDIRNKIGVEVPMKRCNEDFFDEGNEIIQFGLYGDLQNYDIGFRTDEYNKEFIASWVQDVSVDAKVSFNSNRNHFDSDINTETGCFLAPVSYPETLIDEAHDPELRWRQLNWTSNLVCKRARDEKKNRRDEKRNRGQAPPPSSQPPKVVNIADLDVPQVPCHLRPATEADMEAVASIYNNEVLEKLDCAPLGAAEFQKILKDVHGHQFPFIVTVSGSARTNALKDGIRFESSQPQQTVFPPDLIEGIILGFAYLSVWQPGLAGSMTGTSRASAEAHVYVHNSWRRKKIGSALLDRILGSVSLRAKETSKDMCDFWDPSRNRAYAVPVQHTRYTFKIYMQYLVRSELDANNSFNTEMLQNHQPDSIVWVKHLLETKFGFTEKVRFEGAFRSPKVDGASNHWLDSVLFEHTCCEHTWVDHLY